RIAHPQISCLPGILNAEDYGAVWQSLDSVVMPYVVEHYARQSSGMLFESLADAMVPVAPEGTSMAVLMREAGVGLTYQADNNQALHRVLGELGTDFEKFAKRSRDYAPLWRQENAPSKVFDVLEHAWGSDDHPEP